MAKKHFTVVRNSGYRGGEFNIRERHNERKNECYHNGDIVSDRAHLNVHFHRNLREDGTPETYEQTFNRLLENGTIVKRGLQADAKVFDELIFDVNSTYFEENEGYDFAKAFFEEAYRLAVKEIGGEEYVLSAIMHADERNSALSNELGRDVFHYHLHVVYVPVVRKEILWSKRTKDKSLVGKVKEVIPQISHSKKWPIRVPVERDGKTIMFNSYSLLQDRFFEHMKAAGFDGFERGERGSTAKHLDVLEYKTKQEAKRLEEKQRSVGALDIEIAQKQGSVDLLSTEAKFKRARLAKLEKKTVVVKKDSDIFADIDRMADKRTILGDVALSQSDWNTLSALAKEGQKSRGVVKKLHSESEEHREKIRGYEAQRLGVSETIKYFKALQRAPQRLAAAVDDIMQQPPEQSEQNRGRNKAKQEVR